MTNNTDNTSREAPQPESQYIIQTLMEENRTLYENKLYMLSLIKQMQQEYLDAQAMYQVQLESLSKSQANESPSDEQE